MYFNVTLRLIFQNRVTNYSHTAAVMYAQNLAEIHQYDKTFYE